MSEIRRKTTEDRGRKAKNCELRIADCGFGIADLGESLEDGGQKTDGLKNCISNSRTRNRRMMK